MTFEEGLVKEFYTHNIKIYPLGAPEGSVAPFVVYQKNRLDFIKSLDGISAKVNGEYSLVLVCKNYTDLQTKSEEIKNLLLNICWNYIGEDGPYIEAMGLSFAGDNYVYETDEYTSRINLEIKY